MLSLDSSLEGKEGFLDRVVVPYMCCLFLSSKYLLFTLFDANRVFGYVYVYFYCVYLA
jgi:hypothetical protein